MQLSTLVLLIWFTAVAASGCAGMSDFAQGKTANASSEENFGDVLIEYAVDGNDNTRWAGLADTNEQAWYQVDLASAVDVCSVVVHWEQAYATNYTVQCSLEGVSWSDVAQVTGSSGGEQETVVTAGSRCQYVRLFMTARCCSHGTYSIWTLKVLAAYSPPSAPPTAGDDPTFTGADGLTYEVRGQPWRYFNLVSTPRLSLNAQFLPVPDKFVVDPITDTVLGTLHLATCSVPPTKGAIFTPASRRGTLGILFDVTDGSLKCTLTTGVGSKAATPCGPALLAAGVKIRREVTGCSLSPEPRCAYVLEERMPLLMASDASIVRVNIQRTNLTLPSGARTTI